MTSVELKGLSPVGAEDVCGVKLGDPAARIREVFPRANAEDAGDGYTRYDTDDNVSFEIKEGRVFSLKVFIGSGIYLFRTQTGQMRLYSADDLGFAPDAEVSDQDIINAISEFGTSTLPVMSGLCAARRDAYMRFFKE